MVESMFIGTREKMLEVRCPSVTMPSSKIGWANSLNFLNGGASVRRSKAAAKQYEMTWGSTTRDEIRKILDLADGVYGDGEIYWVDPFVADRNMLPQYWASPFQGAYDGLPLVGTARGVLVDTPANTNNFPTKSITYDVVSDPTGVVAETNLVTNPSMEGVTAGTDSTKRTNLVANPSFETDTTGWTASFGTGGAGTAARVAGGYIGGYEYRMTWTTASTGGFSNASGANIAATVGTAYTYSVWVKTSVARQVQATVNWLTSASAYISTSYGTLTSVPANAWTRLSVTATAPANTGFVQPNTVSATNFAIGDTFAIDGAMVEAAPDMRSYFDGTYAEDPTLIEAWTGTVNNSTSTALVRGASNRENLVTNPSLEVDTAGWLNISPSTIVRDTAEKYVGSASLKVTTGTAAGQGAIWTSSGSILTAGVTYTASMWVKGPIGHIVYGLFRPTTGGDIASADITLTGDWQRISVTHTNASGTAQIMVRQRTAATATFYIDAMLLEQSTTVNPYFDGSYTDAPGWTTSWAGTANASRSVATAAPVTVRTNLVTNPSMETVTSGTVVMRRNLAENPRMVTGTYPLSNNSTTNPIVKNSAVPATHPLGITTCVMSSSTGTNSTLLTIYGADGRINTGSVQRTMGVYVYVNEAGYQVSASYGWSATPLTANTWTWVQQTTATATGGWASVSVTKITGNASTTARAYVTGVIAEAGTTVGDFFDGSTTDALGWDYAWSGTANASISTAACAATTVRTNLVPNPSLETNILNIASFAGTGGTNALTRETSGGWIGTSFARATWSVGTTAVSGNMENVTSATTTVGATYTGSAYVRVNSAQRLVLQAIGTSVGTTTVTAVDVPANTWTRLSYTHANVTTAGTLNIRVGVSGGRNWVAGDTLDVDGWLLEASSTVGDYFDGSFNPAGDFSYAWTGTDNASTSIARGATVTGWSAFTPATISQATSQKYVGSSSLLVAATGVNAGALWTVSTVAASTTYTFSAYVKGEVGKSIYLELLEQDSGGTEIGRNTGSNIPMTGDWQQLSVSRTFTTGVRANVRVRNSTVSATHTFYVDAAMLEASPIVQDYFDGSVVSADADLTNSWSGTPHASTSLMRGVRANTVSYFNAVAIQSSGWASTGTKSIRVIPTLAPSASAGYFTVPTTVGQTYTVKGVVRLVAPQTGGITGPRIAAYDGAISTQLGVSAVSPNVAGVTNLSFTFVATTTTSNIIFYNGASAGGGDVWFDNFLVVAGTYTGDYFDGDSSETFNRAYVWTGTPHASTTQALELATQGRTVWIPIPTGHTAHIGAYGTKPTNSDAAVIATPTTGATTYGTPSQLTLLPVTSNARFNKTVKASDGYTGVEISIDGQGQLTLSGLMIQILKDGITPETGEFISGQGHSGCRFTTQPEYTPYSAAFDMVGAVVSLTETGAWSQ